MDMEGYSDDAIYAFLENQSQLFDEPVVSSYEEAEAFLEDSLAVVVDSITDVRDFFDQSGMDIDGMSDSELEDASEVFPLSDGKYLIVEG